MDAGSNVEIFREVKIAQANFVISALKWMQNIQNKLNHVLPRLHKLQVTHDALQKEAENLQSATADALELTTTGIYTRLW